MLVRPRDWVDARGRRRRRLRGISARRPRRRRDPSTDPSTSRPRRRRDASPRTRPHGLETSAEKADETFLGPRPGRDARVPKALPARAVGRAEVLPSKSDDGVRQRRERDGDAAHGHAQQGRQHPAPERPSAIAQYRLLLRAARGTDRSPRNYPRRRVPPRRPRVLKATFGDRAASGRQRSLSLADTSDSKMS